MRVAVFTDVHGNRFALEAVLEDIRAAAPDAILNGGDQVYGGADPAGAWRRLRDLGAPAVRGNTDEMVCAPAEELEGRQSYVEWLHGQLGPGIGEALAGLPLTVEAADGEILLAHGSLQSPWEPLMLVREEGGFRPARSDELLDRSAAFPRARVIIVGHTHREQIVAAGGVTFVNAGSVSRLPDGNPAARWILLERRGSTWDVTFRRTPYDVEGAATWALAHAPDGASEAAQLRSGRPAAR